MMRCVPLCLLEEVEETEMMRCVELCLLEVEVPEVMCRKALDAAYAKQVARYFPKYWRMVGFRLSPVSYRLRWWSGRRCKKLLQRDDARVPQRPRNSHGHM